jgi:hypothetical protein
MASRNIVKDFELVYDSLPEIYRYMVPFKRIMKCLRDGDADIVLDCFEEFVSDLIVSPSQSEAIRHFTLYITDRTYLLLLMNT